MYVVVETACAHCSRPMRVEIDSELGWRALDEGADPFVFVPDVDLYALEDPSIIESF